MRGYCENFYVTCALRDEPDAEGKRWDVQPKIYNALAGELSNSIFVAVKRNGDRVVQTDAALALEFIPGDTVEKDDSDRGKNRRRRERAANAEDTAEASENTEE